jgi:translation initiation factor 1 (eIF-1/SUI1)
VTVKSRNRRKNTTTISGLEAWDIDLKDFSKAVAKSQALGCSTKKTDTGVAIVIQGDVGQLVCDQLLRQYHIPASSIQAVKKQQKKLTPEEVAAKNQPLPQPEFDMGDSSDDDPPEKPPPAKSPRPPPQDDREDGGKQKGRGRGGGRGGGRGRK